jgi:hypothetical protein
MIYLDFMFYNGKKYFVSRGDANALIAGLEPISKEEGGKNKKSNWSDW